jgi:hypothetical protein
MGPSSAELTVPVNATGTPPYVTSVAGAPGRRTAKLVTEASHATCTRMTPSVAVPSGDTSTTLSDPMIRSLSVIDWIIYLRLYFLPNFVTLPGSARSHRDGLAAAVADLARAVRRLPRTTESAWSAASLRLGLAQRQPPQVDGSDVDAPERSGHVSRVSTLHHARAVGRRDAVEALARGRARATGRVDSRRHEFPETGHGVGRRHPTILWGAGQRGQLPGRRHGRLVDGRAGLVAWGRSCMCRRRGSLPRSARGPAFPQRSPSHRSGSWP